MNFLRRLTTTRLLALCAAAVLVIAGGVAIASAALGGGASKPPKRPLAVAVHDAIAAPQVSGISARVTFTNHLVDSSSLPTSSPLLNGAKGRVWLSPGHGFRLELQSDRGDAQLVLNGRDFLLFDGTNNTAYRGTLPQHQGKPEPGRTESAPTLAQVQQGIARLATHVLIGGPTPGTIAGRPAYTVKLSPRQHGGLLGALQVGWDAAHGVPLQVAVFARGNSSPVLSLTATDISYGSVPASTFAITPPHGAHVTDLTPHADQSGPPAAPSLGFKVSAPATLAGRPRDHVQTIGSGADTGALATYGTGLDGLLVIERPAANAGKAPAHALGNLPQLSINGSSGSELVTALGTAVTFERGGVSYTVLGSVTKGVAEAAARGL